MKPGIIPLIFFLFTTKVKTAERLSQTTVKFEPFEGPNFLPLHHVSIAKVENTISATTPTSVYAKTEKVVDKRHVHEQYPGYANFRDLLDQRIRGNSVPQCPCVINPGSDKCIAYDSRYQAASLEEALVAFRDVTFDEEIAETPDVINVDVFACRTLECQTCAAILLDRLKQIGLVPNDVEVSIPIPEFVQPENCRRLRFLRPHSVPNPPPTPGYVKLLIEHGKQYAGLRSAEQISQQPLIYPARENQFWSPPMPVPQPPQPPPLPVPPPPQPPPPPPPALPPLPPPPTFRFIPMGQAQRLRWIIRQRRYQPQYALPTPWIRASGTKIQEGTSGTSGDTKTFQRMDPHGRKLVKRKAEILGTRFVISCIQRGEMDDSEMLALCNVCWTWRKLPPDYFPPLINEFVCAQGSDGHCLSGWGRCQQKYRNFDVLRKVNGDWQPTTISTATCCDCRVRAGTEIHALVVGRT